ncbi:MAG TPA: dynamin family protein [Vicinamibacterales bacterium]|nr:dynamin family protein [Vicinamibacterales bacterium]
MPERLLDQTHDQQLISARRVLADLHASLASIPATADDGATLADAIRQLDELFLLVVVGEFNAGKSAFINALVGSRVLDEGVTPTTSQIHILRYGATPSADVAASGIRVVNAPVDFLRDIHIVDTPGTNAIIREHERLTTEFIPRADFVLFVTSADRPFTETERAFIETIRAWGKKIVIVINKVDIFDRPQEIDTVIAFVGDAAQQTLGTRPPIFPVSARLAGRAKQGEPGLWAASRFEALERYIHESLDETSRFRLKVSSPLGVADVLARRYLTVAEERLALLASDTEALDDIERQLQQYRDDLARGFELRMNGVEKVLLEMEGRGHQYLDDTLRIGRVFDLLNRARVQKEFEDKVVGDAPRQIEHRVSEIIDWLVDQDYRQWQAVSARLAVRQREHGDRILGGHEIGSFNEDRTRLLDSVGRQAQRVVDGYDRRRESELIADGARTAVAATAAVGAGAVGLGALVAVAATTMAADITGLVMASVVAALGFLIIPARRRKGRTELRAKVSALIQDLGKALNAEFTRAQERSAQRFADAMGPYSRFVRAERERWTAHRTALTAIRERITALLAALQ